MTSDEFLSARNVTRNNARNTSAADSAEELAASCAAQYAHNFGDSDSEICPHKHKNKYQHYTKKSRHHKSVRRATPPIIPPTPPKYPPCLKDILGQKCSAPHTLNNLAAFLQSRHSLENLFFLIDVEEYSFLYTHFRAHPAGPARNLLLDLWRKIITTYVLPNSPGELNLPGDTKQRLLQLHSRLGTQPPPAAALMAAYRSIHELLEAAVLPEFISHVAAPEYKPPDRPIPLSPISSPGVDLTRISSVVAPFVDMGEPGDATELLESPDSCLCRFYGFGSCSETEQPKRPKPWWNVPEFVRRFASRDKSAAMHESQYYYLREFEARRQVIRELNGQS